jgi:phosphoglucomutase
MDLLERARKGFQSVATTDEIRERALHFLRQWTTQSEFAGYLPQIQWLTDTEQWASLLERFYQILPFGTGGRRGPVGVGPNRMNLWTLGASVQGHCEYLKEQFPGNDRLLVVLAYDVRQFEDSRRNYNPELPNPLLHLSSKGLAHHAAGVYVANGTGVAILPADSPRFLATPELSYFIRQLGAHGGLNISASHNPPDDNGGKFYDERGGQPVPPDDQIMADLVDQVTTIKSLTWADTLRSGKVTLLDEGLHRAYIDLSRKQSLVPPPRPEDFKVVFTPLHGVGSMTSMEILQAQGFRVIPVESQMKPDGQFPNVTKTPNPEVSVSMDRAQSVAEEHHADLVLATDPDADRIGGMAPDRAGKWRVITGNEIAALLTHFKLSKLSQQGRLPPSPIVVTTEVTTSLVGRVGRKFNAQVIENLLVGFKYVADVLYQLEKNGTYEDVTGSPEDFVIATEESHGILLTAQIRDKDAGPSALLLAELALDQKRKSRTVPDYLEALAREFGYFRNVGVPVFMTGLQGRARMSEMMERLRQAPFQEIGGLKVTGFEDLRDPDGRLGPLKGDTDAAARNVLVFRCGDRVKLILRPSGTEPKAKTYVEVSSQPYRSGMSEEQWQRTCRGVDELLERLSHDFLKQALALVGLDPSVAGH